MKRATGLSIAASLAIPMLLLSCGSSGGSGSNNNMMTPTGVCAELMGYKSSTTTQLTFTNDIQPIMKPVLACGLAAACHGMPGVTVDTKGTRMQSLTDTPANVIAFLRGTSVNAPSMNLVTPNNVGASFLAYKISGADGLACVASSCVSGASIGISKPCGDPMPPSGYTLTASDRTKILDWIAQGAAQ